MANPRQRRKARSGTAKNSISKASRKSMNKVVLKAPAVLVANWDKHKTVRQNYARLGLMPNLNPRQAGGIEPVEGVPFAVAQAVSASFSDLEDGSSDESGDEEEDAEPVASTSTKAALPQAERKLGKGEGRIIRDETGKIIKIILGGDNGREIEEDVVERVRGDSDTDSDEESDSDDEEEAAPAPKPTKGKRKVAQNDEGESPWGAPMREWSGEESDFELEDEVEITGPRSIGQGIPIGAKKRKVHAKTEIVAQLEALAATQATVVRHTSEREADWLLDLVAKFGDDVDKMARDRKANPWQKTPGELRRAITKAGGFSKLKAKLARQAEEDAAAAAAL